MLDAEAKHPREDHVVSDAVLPTDAKYFLELRFLKPFQMFDVPMLKSPRFESVQKGEEDHGSEDHDFGYYGEAEGPVLEPYVCSMNRFGPVVKVFRR